MEIGGRDGRGGYRRFRRRVRLVGGSMRRREAAGRRRKKKRREMGRRWHHTRLGWRRRVCHTRRRVRRCEQFRRKGILVIYCVR